MLGRFAFAVTICANLAALGLIWGLYPRPLDYGGATQAALTYFQVHIYVLLPASPCLL